MLQHTPQAMDHCLLCLGIIYVNDEALAEALLFTPHHIMANVPGPARNLLPAWSIGPEL